MDGKLALIPQQQKLMDEWKLLMEQKKYVQGIHYDYRNGSALNRWGI